MPTKTSISGLDSVTLPATAGLKQSLNWDGIFSVSRPRKMLPILVGVIGYLHVKNFAMS